MPNCISIISCNKFNTLMILLFFCLNIYSQTPSVEAYCDCEKSFRIDLSDSLRINVKSPYCTGKNEMEFSKNAFIFQKEHNTAWFIINIKKCGILTLTISPLQKKDDYDFMIFKDSLNTCELISKGLHHPVRSNLAEADLKESKTGLDRKSKDLFCNKESKMSFSKYIKVMENQTYILVLDNLNKGKGCELNFKIQEIEKFKIRSFDYDLKAPLLQSNYYFLTKNNEQLYVELNSNEATCNLEFIKKHNRLPVPSSEKFHENVKDFDHVMVTNKGYIAEVLTNLYMPCSEVYNVYLKKLIKGQKYFCKGIYMTEALEIDTARSNYFIHALKHTIISNGPFSFSINDIITEQPLTTEQKQIVANKLAQIINDGVKLKVDIIINESNPENNNGIILKFQ